MSHLRTVKSCPNRKLTYCRHPDGPSMCPYRGNTIIYGVACKLWPKKPLRQSKPIVLEQAGAFVTVKYPYRMGRDLYVMIAGQPCFCAQCQAKFKVEELIEHIHGHDRRKHKAEILSVKDGQVATVVEITPVEKGESGNGG